jgi:hypothetical protein
MTVVAAAPGVRVGSQPMLDAMDGVAYLTDEAGTVLACGEPAWGTFATANGARALTRDAMVGRNLFDAIEGAEVRAAWLKLHASVVTGYRTRIAFDYRCDAPDTERFMRMAVSTVRRRPRPLVLYQSQLLNAVPRPWMGLFARPGFNPTAGRGFVVVCAYCHDVHATPDAPWIPPVDYYRDGGSDDVDVSHGVCPRCWATIVEPNVAPAG